VLCRLGEREAQFTWTCVFEEGNSKETASLPAKLTVTLVSRSVNRSTPGNNRSAKGAQLAPPLPRASASR
jgi:hypothetical protein